MCIWKGYVGSKVAKSPSSFFSEKIRGMKMVMRSFSSKMHTMPSDYIQNGEREMIDKKLQPGIWAFIYELCLSLCFTCEFNLTLNNKQKFAKVFWNFQQGLLHYKLVKCSIFPPLLCIAVIILLILE